MSKVKTATATTTTNTKKVDLTALKEEGVIYIGRSADDGVPKDTPLENMVLVSVFAQSYPKKSDGKQYGGIFGLFTNPENGTKKATIDLMDEVIIGSAYTIQKTERVKDGNTYYGYQLK